MSFGRPSLESLRARTVDWLREAGSAGELAWRAATWLVLVYAVVQALHAWAAGFGSPLLDRHAFRQTQTALTTYYIAHGGPLFAYEMPVFGAPYSAPFELPLYQWIVALVHRVGRVPLDQSGRAVSIAFFALTSWPFFRFLRRSGVSAASARLAIAVLLAAPEYLYWTRAFLIESTALFLAVSVLAMGVDLLDRPAIDRRLAWIFATASLALLVKVTTAFGYVAALGILSVAQVLRDRERRAHLPAYGAYFASAFVLPAILVLGWTRFADYEKGLNPLTARYLTSAALHDWNFGTWAQKTATATWLTLWDRTMNETFATAVGFAAFGAIALFARKRVETVLALVAGVVGTYAVFTNLHVVHDYYQYSTAALAVLVVGLGFGAAEVAMPRGRALLLCVSLAMVVKATSTYEESDLPGQLHVDPNLQRTGHFIREHTAPSALIAIFGDEWSSVIPYYAERRALMDVANHDASDPSVQGGLERSAALGNRLGAVVTCNAERARSRARAETLFARPPVCTSFASCDVCL